MLVQDVMTREPQCCHERDTLADAARTMWEQDCGVVPVCDDAGRPIGMITDRDICMATLMQDKPPSQIQVRAAMSRNVFTCSPRDTVQRAETIMRDRQVRRLPVVDELDNVIGILALNDLARAASAPTRRRDGISAAEVEGTLAAIGEARA